MNARRPDFPKVLMATSLVLLAAFLVLFLKKTYDGEKAALMKEVGYLFMGAVRGIEGEALEMLVRRRAAPPAPPEGGSNTPAIDDFGVEGVVPPPSGRAGGAENPLRKTGDKVEVRVERRSEKRGPADMSGSISMVVELGDKPGDTTARFFEKKEFLPLLTAHFDSAMSVAGLPVSHQVLTSAGSDTSSQNLPTGSYTDLASGERFSAQIDDYQWFVLKKMLPNILFSIAVFGFVALAFFSTGRSLAEQKKLVALKNDLLQNISHELKTPVSTVGVALEALGSFDALRDENRTREYLDISKNELARLTLLVDKVLGMAQFERGAMPMQVAVFDFRKMIEEVLAAMRLQFEKSGAAVVFEASGERFEVSGDALHLSGVVFNLLDNALKYSTLRPEIYVKLTSTASETQLEIADNGPGIPPEFRERVFEKFFRIPTGARHDVKGHGLGLSYAAEVIRLHGGRIWAEGNSFFVKISN